MSPLWFLFFLASPSRGFNAITQTAPSKPTDWKNSTLTQQNSRRSYLTVQLLGVWICNSQYPNDQMWLWLLSLLFDQTVTTENTRWTEMHSWLQSHQRNDIIYRHSGLWYTFWVNHTELLIVPLWFTIRRPALNQDVCGCDSFPTHCLPSSIILLLNISASLEGNLLTRVWRLHNTEPCKNSQSLLSPSW